MSFFVRGHGCPPPPPPPQATGGTLKNRWPLINGGPFKYRRTTQGWITAKHIKDNASYNLYTSHHVTGKSSYGAADV